MTMRRTFILVVFGNTSASILLFARNLILARLLEVSDYGIASAFALAMAAVEMAAGFGLPEFVVQNRRGDDDELLAGVHSFSVMRGLVAFLALFFMSGPISSFFDIEHVAWAFRLLSVTAFIKGLEHFDPLRLSRALNFRALMFVRVFSAFASIVIVGPMYYLFGDFRLALVAIFAQVFFSLLLSHFLAERKYRLSCRGPIFFEILSFGWPIWINGLLLFAVFQGDRIVVGRFFDLETFAFFSLAVTVVLAPILVVAGSEGQYFLSFLSSKRDDGGLFSELASAVVQTSFVFSVTTFFALILLMPLAVTILLGEKYESVVLLITPLAVQYCIRNLKVGCTTVAISLARTSNALLSNLTRILFFPISWLVVTHGASLVDLIWISAAGEFFGFLVSLALISRQTYIPKATVYRSAAAALMVFGQSYLFYTYGGGFYVLGIATAAFATFFFSYEFRRLILAKFLGSGPV